MSNRMMGLRAAAGVAVSCGFALLVQVSGAGASPEAQAGTSPAYTGSGSCSSSNCHGSLRPKTVNRIPQDEHTIWVTKDEHANAYSHLLGERSKTIARNLGLKNPPEKESRCLDCHALNVPEALRARSFDLADGVSCEACHGAAEKWLGPHTTRDWPHERSVGVGMRDTKDPLVRAEVCSGCHVGTKDRTVDHELYAAGHPELVFELQWASASMPRHWREAAARGNFFGTRLWGVGEAVHLREQMARAERAAGAGWPEFAEFDCASCHHGLEQKSWRQQRGYEGRRPGDLPFDLARWRVLAPLARRVAPEAAAQIDKAAADLAAVAGRPGASAAAAKEPAVRIRAAVEALARKLAEPATDLGREPTLALLAALASDPGPAREFGYRGAGQIAMSIDSLTRAFIEGPGAEAAARAGDGPAVEAKALDAAVDLLFKALDDPTRYDPAVFTEALRGVATHLPGGRAVASHDARASSSP